MFVCPIRALHLCANKEGRRSSEGTSGMKQKIRPAPEAQRQDLRHPAARVPGGGRRGRAPGPAGGDNIVYYDILNVILHILITMCYYIMKHHSITCKYDIESIYLCTCMHTYISIYIQERRGARALVPQLGRYPRTRVYILFILAAFLWTKRSSRVFQAMGPNK